MVETEQLTGRTAHVVAPRPSSEAASSRSAGRRTRAAGVVLVVGGSIVVDGTPAVDAAGFVVTNTDPSGAGSLRDAIDQANATAAADVITFAPGLTGAITFADTARIKHDLEIVGPGAGAITVTSATGDVLYAYNTAALTVSSLTFDQAPQDAIHGGNTGDVVITDVVITDSFDDGIQISTGGDVTITDSTITGSGASGIAADGVGAVTVERTSTTSHGNHGLYLQALDSFEGAGITSTGHGGVGIRATNTNANGPVRIIDSLFGSNAEYGVDIGSVGDVTIEGTTTSGNNQAGLNILSSDAVVIDDSVMRGNNGPGLYARNLDSLTISDSTAETNTVGLRAELVSGAVEMSGSTLVGNGERALELVTVAGGALVENSTITENTAAGVNPVVSASSTDLVIAHTTIAGNLDVNPPDSSAIGLDASDLVLDHVIVSGNSAMDSVSAGVGSTVSSVEYSVVTPGSGFAGTSIELADPELLPAAGNGGPTATMLPARGSPVVDAGDPAFVPPPAVDQRGQPRVDGVIDIGAVEGVEQPAIVPLAPARFVDTRANRSTVDGQFAGEGKRVGGSEYRVKLAGRGNVPTDAAGVVANVTAVAPDRVGFVTVHPCVTPRPNAASLNFTPGVALGNEIVAGLDASGEACFFVSDGAHLTVDVVGYVPTGAPTTLVAPARLMDSRTGQSTIDGLFAGQGIRAGGSTTRLDVVGRGGVPNDAAAVIVNVTAVRPGSIGFVTVHPCLSTLPTAASLNYTGGVNRGNELVAEISATGEICLFTSDDVHLTVDVAGYLPAGSSLTSISPARLLDTRTGATTIDAQFAGGGPRGAGSELALPVAGRAGVPAGATAAVLNVTSVGPSGTGFVTAHPCVTPRPLASSLNFVAAVNGGNEVIASLDAAGRVCLFASEQTHLTVDVVGYLS